MRAAIVCIALAACGGSKRSAPDPDAICSGTQPPRDALVLRTSDPTAGGKARGLREAAARAQSAKAIAELDRFIADTDAQAMFEAHVAERARKLHEDTELAHAIVAVMQTEDARDRQYDGVMQPPERPGPFELGTGPGFAGIGLGAVKPDERARKAEDARKPLTDGSAVAAVRVSATALATALAELAKRVAALEGAADHAAASAQLTEAIKIANVAHGKLNEAIARMHATAITLASLADEADARRYATFVRLWTRVAAISARLADPWPASVIVARSRAFVVPSPRQWAVTCAAPAPRAAPPSSAATLAAVTGARDALSATLGFGLAPASPAPPPTLEALLAALAAP